MGRGPQRGYFFVGKARERARPSSRLPTGTNIVVERKALARQWSRDHISARQRRGAPYARRNPGVWSVSLPSSTVTMHRARHVLVVRDSLATFSASGAKTR